MVPFQIHFRTHTSRVSNANNSTSTSYSRCRINHHVPITKINTDRRHYLRRKREKRQTRREQEGPSRQSRDPQRIKRRQLAEGLQSHRRPVEHVQGWKTVLQPERTSESHEEVARSSARTRRLDSTFVGPASRRPRYHNPRKNQRAPTSTPATPARRRRYNSGHHVLPTLKRTNPNACTAATATLPDQPNPCLAQQPSCSF